MENSIVLGATKGLLYSISVLIRCVIKGQWCYKATAPIFFQKRTHKKKPKVPYQEAQTAQEAIQKIIQEKKISSKINYDVLNDLTFNASSIKSSSNKGDNPGEAAAVSAAAAIHQAGPILENRASTLLRLKKVNSSAHLEVSVNHAGYLNLIDSFPVFFV